MSEVKYPQSSIDSFLALADSGDWTTFDQQVIKVCDNPAHIEWATDIGLQDPRETARDLAISIFEQTSQEKLNPLQQEKLVQVFKNDNSLHLKRKASFALFKFGDRRPEIIERIKEARKNDPELKSIAESLLAQL